MHNRTRARLCVHAHVQTQYVTEFRHKNSVLFKSVTVQLTISLCCVATVPLTVQPTCPYASVHIHCTAVNVLVLLYTFTVQRTCPCASVHIHCTADLSLC